jgi:hypothetical protein
MSFGWRGWSRRWDGFRHDGRDGLAAAAAPLDTAEATTAVIARLVKVGPHTAAIRSLLRPRAVERSDEDERRLIHLEAWGA